MDEYLCGRLRHMAEAQDYLGYGGVCGGLSVLQEAKRPMNSSPYELRPTSPSLKPGH